MDGEQNNKKVIADGDDAGVVYKEQKRKWPSKTARLIPHTSNSINEYDTPANNTYSRHSRDGVPLPGHRKVPYAISLFSIPNGNSPNEVPDFLGYDLQYKLEFPLF